MSDQNTDYVNRLRKSLGPSQREMALEAALRFYADPFSWRDEYGDPANIPDFYDETDFGHRAREALGSAE